MSNSSGENYARLLPIHFSRFLTDTGGGAGSFQMAVDGSATPVEYRIDGNGRDNFEIHQLIMFMRDNGGDFLPEEFASRAKLVNGLTIEYSSGAKLGLVVDLLDGDTIQSNGGFSAHFSSTELFTWGQGNGVRTMVSRWGFKALTGQPIILSSEVGASFKITVNDDLTALSDLTMKAEGKVIRQPRGESAALL